VLEAETDRAFVAAARRVVVLADHTKWGTLGISTIAALEDADELISDDLLGGEARRILGERVGRLRLAPTTAPPDTEAGPVAG
jgi:DeoR family glycerol-3-phosphate regulon repressor